MLTANLIAATNPNADWWPSIYQQQCLFPFSRLLTLICLSIELSVYLVVRLSIQGTSVFSGRPGFALGWLVGWFGCDSNGRSAYPRAMPGFREVSWQLQGRIPEERSMAYRRIAAQLVRSQLCGKALGVGEKSCNIAKTMSAQHQDSANYIHLNCKFLD